MRMPSAGHAQATVNTKKNCLRIANLFPEHVAEVSPDLTAKWGIVWEEIPEQYAADMEIYEHKHRDVPGEDLHHRRGQPRRRGQPEQQGCNPGLV